MIINAIGFQREIVEKIVVRNGDYRLVVKTNQNKRLKPPESFMAKVRRVTLIAGGKPLEEPRGLAARSIDVFPSTVLVSKFASPTSRHKSCRVQGASIYQYVSNAHYGMAGARRDKKCAIALRSSSPIPYRDSAMIVSRPTAWLDLNCCMLCNR